MAKRRLSGQQVARIRQNQERRRQRAARRASASVEQPGLGAEQTGLVIAHYGATLVVENTAGLLYDCSARQNLPNLVCGDRVVWQAIDDHKGVVVALQPRRSLLSRPDPSGRVKLIAANLDQVAVVVAPKPPLDEFLIDRYLVAVENIGLIGLIVLNKIDLLKPAELAERQQRLATFARLGYRVLLASTRSDHGLDALRDELQGHTSILVGQSGVGKSSLSQALLPEREIRIRALSETTGLGTHTTTTSTLYHLPDGGDLIDSPGVRNFELGEIDPRQLERGFVEFRPLLGRCRFADCSHTVEPDCALSQAGIDPRRLASYRQLRAALSRPNP